MLLKNKKQRKKIKNEIEISRKKIKSQEITMITRQIATLVTAGIPLVQSLNMIEEITSQTTLYHLIKKIKEEIESGTSFSNALMNYPKHFDDLYYGLIEIGEQSGTLDIMLDRLATHKEKQAHLTRKIKSALYYPIAVFMVAISVSIILLLKVVPTFEKMFQDFSAELPFFTKLILKLSTLLQDYGLHILIFFCFVTYFSLSLYKKNIRFKNRVQRFILHIPIVGLLLKKTMIARFSRTLAITTKAGIPISDALNTVSKALGNIVFSSATFKIKQGLIEGLPLHKMMKKTNVFISVRIFPTILAIILVYFNASFFL